ncbi:MAG: hypothetical protein WC570_03925 [Patescibacteria group bacterium]
MKKIIIKSPGFFLAMLGAGLILGVLPFSVPYGRIFGIILVLMVTPKKSLEESEKEEGIYGIIFHLIPCLVAWGFFIFYIYFGLELWCRSK